MTDREVLDLLQRMDEGYSLSAAERAELERVTTLDLQGAGLDTLPESIGFLTGLTRLVLSRNRLTSLPESIGSLTGLIILDLSRNNLTSLPKSIGSLTGLTSLDLMDNNLTSLPESIGSLTGLTRLRLSVNNLTALPDSIGSLTGLTRLRLSFSNLTSLPESIGSLTGLTRLDLWGNDLTALPEGIANLKKLRYLDLSQNHLDKLPSCLLDLKVPFFGEFSILSKEDAGIFLKGTTLSLQPVSLFDQSQDDSPNHSASRKLIEDYFNAPHVPLQESKVILLGNPNAGKTYTVQRLLNGCQKGDYHTEPTHGILIEELHSRRGGEEYNVRIWDFGGQDIMNEMHRCFLTERTCYVILVDTRSNGQTQQARHWMRTVQSVAPDAPVVLLVNEMTGSVNWDLDGTTLREEYPNLKEIHYCSARTAGEEEFRREVEAPILRQALEMDSCKMTLPKSWEQVRQKLLALREKKYYIDRAGFHTLCDDHGVPKDDQLRVWLLNWFNDMGVCFSYHFEDGKERQEDYKILEPAWLTSAIYRLIWEKKPSDDGIITRTEIDLILSSEGSPEKREEGVPCLDGVSYDKEEQGYVLDIMRKFQISYPVDKEHEFMPVLCKPDSKRSPAPEGCRQQVSVRFRYGLLPETVIHRLMIHCYRFLQQGRFWRSGFELENPVMGLRAVVFTKDSDTLQIDVYAREGEYDVSEWLQPICKQLVKINERLKLKAEQLVMAENDEGSDWFKLERRVWYCYSKGQGMIFGDENCYEIQPLLELVYGRFLDKAKAAYGVADRSEQREAEQYYQDSVPELIKALEENTAAQRTNTAALNANTAALQENTRRILDDIRTGALTPTREQMDAILAAMQNTEQKTELLIELVSELLEAQEETRLDKLRGMLEISANAAAIGGVVARVWPVISGLFGG